MAFHAVIVVAIPAFGELGGLGDQPDIAAPWLCFFLSIETIIVFLLIGNVGGEG